MHRTARSSNLTAIGAFAAALAALVTPVAVVDAAAAERDRPALSEVVQILDEMRAGRLRAEIPDSVAGHVPLPPARPGRGAQHHAFVLQQGDHNRIAVTQGGPGGNHFTGLQRGKRNTAGAHQFGSDNAAVIVQRGNDNTATDLTQIGHGHVAIWRQIGNNLGGISITQTPGAPPVIVTQR